MATATKVMGVDHAGPGGLISCEFPPTFSEEDTVWMGFMDIVPVLGTVRESVELVLALYEGNKAVVKEKEKAIENIVKESFQKHVKKLSVPVKPAAEAEFSGLRNVREVTKGMIIEHVKKGSKKGTKPTPPQQSERQKRVEDIRKDVLGKIRSINPDCNQVLLEELGRSKRGEHVFNNNILKFHSKVLKEFIQNKIYNQQAVNELGTHTLPPNAAEDIKTNMVVHFDEDEFYVNANAVTYGVFCGALREAMLRVLGRRNPGDVTQNEKERVNTVIDDMNNRQIYVDDLAKEKWILQDKTGTRQNRFEDVRQKVANMYKNDRGFDWCIRILREVPSVVSVL